MSFSSIIKLHNFRPKRIVIGAGSPNGGPTAAMSSFRPGSDPAATGLRLGDLPGVLDKSKVLNWMADAQEIIRQARADAEDIMEKTKDKADEIHHQAWNESYQKGYSEGLAKAAGEASASTRQIAELARNVATDMAQVLTTAEEVLLDLALAIAEKVVHKTLAEDRSTVLPMVKWALEQVDVAEIIRVRVNPEDVKLLQPYWDGQVDLDGKTIPLAPDPHVQVGGCVIDTNSSVIDAQIGTKFAEIEEALRSSSPAGGR